MKRDKEIQIQRFIVILTNSKTLMLQLKCLPFFCTNYFNFFYLYIFTIYNCLEIMSKYCLLMNYLKLFTIFANKSNYCIDFLCLGN